MGVGYSTTGRWDRRERQNGTFNDLRKLTPEQKLITQFKKAIEYLKEVNVIIKKANMCFVNNPSR